MKNTAASFLIIFFSVCCPAASGWADKIICTDGTVYEGIITDENEEVIIMEIPAYPITIQVYKGAVKNILNGTREENSALKKAIKKIKQERGYIE